MNVRPISQPDTQMGNEFDALLGASRQHEEIFLVSAFVSLRTILRLRERLLEQVSRGARLRLTIGIDLDGTSKDVLEELLRWGCEVFVFHNTVPRATFHPKVYLFRSTDFATLYIGSNNLTDGGLYTNYEAATRYQFTFPDDRDVFIEMIAPLARFFQPRGVTVQALNEELIRILSLRRVLKSEREIRAASRRVVSSSTEHEGEEVPESPFLPDSVPMPPLLPETLRRQEASQEQETASARDAIGETEFEGEHLRDGLQTEGAMDRDLRSSTGLTERGVLIWRKRLPRTDALQVNVGSHHVGGVRLTQARFENPVGQRIDQTTYFRRIFADYHWEPEDGRHLDQEHTFVPMRVVIRGTDYGILNFEISHKPTGEAGQDNYTTILRWGRNFTPTVIRENLTDAIFSLYETPDADAPFFIEID